VTESIDDEPQSSFHFTPKRERREEEGRTGEEKGKRGKSKRRKGLGRNNTPLDNSRYNIYYVVVS
jgi:hypothetical protein